MHNSNTNILRLMNRQPPDSTVARRGSHRSWAPVLGLLFVVSLLWAGTAIQSCCRGLVLTPSEQQSVLSEDHGYCTEIGQHPAEALPCSWSAQGAPSAIVPVAPASQSDRAPSVAPAPSWVTPAPRAAARISLASFPDTSPPAGRLYLRLGRLLI